MVGFGTFPDFRQLGCQDFIGPDPSVFLDKKYKERAANVSTIGKMTIIRIRKLLQVKIVRHHYTYEGVLSQLEMFFSDPFGTNGGQLRCNRLPFRNH